MRLRWIAYAVTHAEGAIEHGGVIWVPLLATASVDMLYAAGLGYSYALECRAAKRRGAEQAELARRKEAKANARAEAGTLWNSRAFVISIPRAHGRSIGTVVSK